MAALPQVLTGRPARGETGKGRGIESRSWMPMWVIARLATTLGPLHAAGCGQAALLELRDPERKRPASCADRRGPLF